MDSLTHILLGGAIAQVAIGRRVGFTRAFWLGALAATLPDADGLAHTGDTMRDHAFHRYFMHSLVIVPLLAAIATVPFVVQRKARPFWKSLYFAAVIACVSHTLLDLLTSYGTMILWPFTTRRYALDIVAVVDIAYTLPLLVGVILAWRTRKRRWAAAALTLSFLYLGLATLQHSRAAAAQRALLAARHVSAAENPRVLPQIGGTLSYRSIYIADHQIYADAIRVPYFSAPLFKQGGSTPRVTYSIVQGFLHAGAGRDFDVFNELADGFVARSPVDPLLLADERYAFLPEGLESVWGIQIEKTDRTLFRITPRWDYVGRLARDLFRPQGYASLESFGEMP